MDLGTANKSETTCGSEFEEKWKRRSKLEQRLIIAIAGVVCVLIGLILFIIIKHAVSTNKCKTPGCLQAASTIVTHIDPKIDPCDDFFKFACGTFIENTHGDIKAASISKLRAKVERQLEEIIREPIKDDDHYLVKNQKEFFEACMNETTIQEESLEIFKETLRELHGWPVAAPYYWNQPTIEWKSMIYILREKGYPHGMVLNVGTIEDSNNTNRYIIRVSPPVIQKIKKENRAQYIKYMTEVAVIFGADKTRAGTEMERVCTFMENLRKIVDKHNTDTDENSTRFTVGAYQDIHHDINWLEFINTLLYPIGDISNDTYVCFPKHEFTKDLFKLIRSTQKSVLANYIIWTVIEDIMKYMSKELQGRKSNYTCSTGTAPEDTETRFKFCQQEMKQCFYPQPSDIIYARRYLPAAQREQLKKMVQNVKTAFKQLLRATSWMDEETKNKVLEKAYSMVEIIGAPRDYFNDAALEQLPPGNKNNIKNDSYFEMVLSYRKRRKDAEYFLIHMNVSDIKWDKFYGFITHVDAMYSPQDNAITLPVGILQDIFYDIRRPMYLNYGTIGGIIGHELTHGFCGVGSEFDKDGRESSIWTNATQEAYEEKIKCIIEEADSFDTETDGHKVNGSLTLEENIADYTGIKVAYAAYKTWVRQHGEEMRLPGISYTPYQLFWISAVSYECFKLDGKNEHQSEVHADSAFRGTGPMRNNPDFARDFNCRVGSRMNPLKKCHVF